VNAVKISEGEV